MTFYNLQFCTSVREAFRIHRLGSLPRRPQLHPCPPQLHLSDVQHTRHPANLKSPLHCVRLFFFFFIPDVLSWYSRVSTSLFFRVILTMSTSHTICLTPLSRIFFGIPIVPAFPLTFHSSFFDFNIINRCLSIPNNVDR